MKIVLSVAEASNQMLREVGWDGVAGVFLGVIDHKIKAVCVTAPSQRQPSTITKPRASACVNTSQHCQALVHKLACLWPLYCSLGFQQEAAQRAVRDKLCLHKNTSL